MVSSNPTNLFVLNNHISVKAAALFSGYSLQYLRRMLRTGKLNGVKIGQHLEDLVQCSIFMNSQPWRSSL
jgi:hypothetical protein